MHKKFNGTTVETNGVRSIAGGGTGATTAEQARINLGITGGGVTSYNDLTDKPTLGTAAATAASDYAAASHKSRHATGGADALTPADIGAAASSHTHPLSHLEQSSATNGQVPVWDGTAWVAQTPSSGGIPTANIQIFTASGTWAKPTGAKSVNIQLVGGGGGGGSGRKGAAGSVRSGGGGGGGAGTTFYQVDASSLGTTIAVVIGAGGLGGASQTANSTNGNAGVDGGDTIFGIFRARGGNGGNAGTATVGNGGPGGEGQITGGAGGTGGGSSSGTPAATGIFISGGGGGGGTNASNTNITSTNGGRVASTNLNTVPASPTVHGLSTALGQGGGGGSASQTGNGTNGFAGGLYGGGGGGGGAATDGVGNSGAGGQGGAGIAIITTYF